MKVLVALDGSALSESILPRLGWVREVPNAEIMLFRVILESEVRNFATGTPVTTADPMDPRWRVEGQFDPTGRRMPEAGPPPGEVYDDEWEKAQRHAVSAAEQYLTGLTIQFGSPHAAVSADISDDVAATIVDRARQEGASFIAMATHGRSGLSQLFAGSVAQKVLQDSEIPVMVYRPRADA